MVKENRKPQFFKFFLPGINDTRLMIPFAFLKHLKGRHSGSASLIGPSGNIWHVDLVENSKGAFLQSGWPEFARDHSVRAGYCLIFRHKGRLKFSVEIYDTSACVKMDSVHAKPSYDSISQEDVKKTSKHESRKRMRKQQTFCEETVCSTKLDSEKMLHEVKPSSFTKKKAAVKLKNRQVHAHRCVTEEEVEKAYADAMSFTSENPTFLTVMRKAYCAVGFYMALPKSFSERQPKASNMVTLYDQSGKPWEVKYIYSPDRDCGAFSGGWKAFAVGHNLREHDVCVFEVIGSNKIRVHVFRVVDGISESPPQSAA
ncbi:hypothetical protein H6P81_012899 [Aristolochia fimbriata]|uniref:TF-B3 domain-containing protein n=1 Tax=Aristolochia fimbriata TaxID=158543 RepID=A0AAV7EG02_ARIFI|nr:hypothetical protein H6P81_012899 [Aristolochia fimbriata]